MIQSRAQAEMIKWHEVNPLKRLALSKRMVAPVRIKGQSVNFSLPFTLDLSDFYLAPPPTPTPAALYTNETVDQETGGGDSSSIDNWDTDCVSSDAFEEASNNSEGYIYR